VVLLFRREHDRLSAIGAGAETDGIVKMGTAGRNSQSYFSHSGVCAESRETRKLAFVLREAHIHRIIGIDPQAPVTERRSCSRLEQGGRSWLSAVR